MKKISFLILLILGFTSSAQGTFSDVEKGITRVSQLDSVYKNVLDPDPAQALFNGKGSLYYDAHEKLLADLTSFLKKNNFSWGSPVKAMARIYYKKSGEVDHFICDLKKAGVADEKSQQFDKLLREFLQNYKINISANKNYYHRSPITFKD